MKTKMSEAISTELEQFAKRRLMAGSMMSRVLEDGLDSEMGEHDFNFGTPPFFVIDGEADVMGILDEKGDFTPFPFNYDLDGDAVDSDRYDMIYSTFGPGGSILRLIPAKTDFEPPGIESGDFFETEYTEIPGVLWEGVDLATAEIEKLVEQRLGAALTRKVAGLHDRVAMLSLDPEIELPEGLNGQVMLVQMLADGTNMMRIILSAYIGLLQEIEQEIANQAEDQDESDDEEEDTD